MSEEPEDRQIEELEEREKELDDQIEETESQWETAQQEAPSTVDDEGQEPLDEDNPVGGI